MPEQTPPAKTFLTPSWSLLPASINLYRTHVYSLFWLVIFPSVLNSVGWYLLSSILRKLPKDASFATTIKLFADSPLWPVSVAILLVSTVWFIAVYPATIVLAAQASRGEGDSPWRYFLVSGHYWWRLIGLVILTTIVVGVGFVLLIIPGLIFLRRYVLAPYYLVERDLGVLEAMRTSSAQTRPVHWYVWGTLGVGIVITLAASVFGSIPFAGMLLVPIFSAIYFFGLALRQKEISELSPESTAPKVSGKSPAARRRKI